MNYIVIVRCGLGKVIIYDILKNEFCESSLNLITGYKFIFAANTKVYIGECQKNVYESDSYDLRNWTRISTQNPVLDNQTSYSTIKNFSVYFLMNYKIYKFKLKTKKFKPVIEL